MRALGESYSAGVSLNLVALLELIDFQLMPRHWALAICTCTCIHVRISLNKKHSKKAQRNEQQSMRVAIGILHKRGQLYCMYMCTVDWKIFTRKNICLLTLNKKLHFRCVEA